MTIDWKNDVQPLVLESVEWFPEHGVEHPQVRTLYYRLSDTLEVIPATEYWYKKLDALTVEMRKAEKISFGFFTVQQGVSFGGPRTYWDPGEFLEYRKEGLLNSASDYSLSKWYKQPRVVEVWVEKVGLGTTFHFWLDDLGVEVKSNQGYGTWEFIYESMNSLAEEVRSGGRARTCSFTIWGI